MPYVDDTVPVSTSTPFQLRFFVVEKLAVQMRGLWGQQDLEFVGGVGTLKVAPALPGLRLVRLELASDRAGLIVGQARGILLGGRHVS